MKTSEVQSVTAQPQEKKNANENKVEMRTNKGS